MTTRSDQPGTRFGARAVFAALALLLVAVPFGLLLFLVEDKWPPLLDVDADARDSLHAFAVDHEGFVTALRVLSTIGSAVVYAPLFALVAVGLLLVTGTWEWLTAELRQWAASFETVI